MANCNPVTTPMEPGLCLLHNQSLRTAEEWNFMRSIDYGGGCHWLTTVSFLHHLARYHICSWSTRFIHFRSWCSTLECHQTPILLHSRIINLWHHLFPRFLELLAVPDLFQCKPWWLQGFWLLHKHICGQDWNWHCLLDVEAPTYCRSLYHRSQVCGTM